MDPRTVRQRREELQILDVRDDEHSANAYPGGNSDPGGVERHHHARRRLTGVVGTIDRRIGLLFLAFLALLGIAPREFARHLLRFYQPELHRLLFEVKQ